MSVIKSYYKRILVAAMFGVLVACGGGGSDSGNILTGHFSDSPVTGLSYSTATQSGVTDEAGTFTYKSGETITFSVGDIVLGEMVEAKADMTPLDIVPGAKIYTTNDAVEKLLASASEERKAFYRMTNTLIFLQTLDDDANPDNGINIPADVAAMFSGVTINFEQSHENFSDRDANKELRQISNQAASRGLLNRGVIRKPGQALDHFYSAQGFNVSFTVLGSGPVKAETRDEQGNVLSESLDKDGDGNPDEITILEYDAQGNVLLKSFDKDGDGISDEIIILEYDAQGNVLLKSLDKDGDGISDEIIILDYDTQGNLGSESIKIDSDGNGSPDEITNLEYDAQGNVLSESLDKDGDGNPDEITTLEYDAQGNVLSESLDKDGDGNPDEITTLEYDAQGNVLSESLDKDGDGNPDGITTLEYDAQGNVLSERFDEDGDGNPDEITTLEYDAQGKVLSKKIDSDGDGNPEYTVQAWTYDAQGNELTYKRDDDGDGNPDYLRTRTYDAEGNMLTYSVDEDGDGSSEYNHTWTYDADGNQASYSFDSDGDGASPPILTSYDLVSAGWAALLASLEK